MGIRILMMAVTLFLLVVPTAEALPKHAPKPGGVVHVALGQSPTKPKAMYLGRPVWVTRDADAGWLALVGVDVSAALGAHELDVSIDNLSQQNHSFIIEAFAYPQEKFTIKQKIFDSQAPEVEQRIIREGRLLSAAFARFNESAEQHSFVMPVKGRLVKNYGAQRIINNIPKKPHKGVDIVAPLGTAVISVSEGVVSLTDDLFFTGKTVVVDHGQGLQSLYCHLDKSEVSIGQHIKQGQKLGTVGKTGRATGPHLHFGMSLNNVRVDPLLFLEPTQEREKTSKAKS